MKTKVRLMVKECDPFASTVKKASSWTLNRIERKMNILCVCICVCSTGLIYLHSWRKIKPRFFFRSTKNMCAHTHSTWFPFKIVWINFQKCQVLVLHRAYLALKCKTYTRAIHIETCKHSSSGKSLQINQNKDV